MKTFFTLLFTLSMIIYVSALTDFLNQDTSLYNEQKSNFLIKRETKRYSRRSSQNCAKKICSLDLKPCPKDCPQSCGYLNSPDPCCPLLGKPTCPDL